MLHFIVIPHIRIYTIAWAFSNIPFEPLRSKKEVFLANSFHRTLLMAIYHDDSLDGDNFEDKHNNHDKDSQKSIVQQSKAADIQDLERYRNRAELLQHTLQSKVQDIQKLQAKALVLQDVIKRLKLKSQKDIDDLNLSNQDELNLWKDKLLQVKRQSDVLILQKTQTIQQLQADVHRMGEEIASTISQKDAVIKEMEQQILDNNHELQRLNQKLKNTKKDWKDLQMSLMKKDEELQSLDDRYQLLLQENKKRENEAIQIGKSMEELEQQYQEALRLAQQAETMRQETILIASAAVESAEKRERELRDEVQQAVQVEQHQTEKEEPYHSQQEYSQQQQQEQQEHYMTEIQRLQNTIQTLEKNLLEEQVSHTVKYTKQVAYQQQQQRQKEQDFQEQMEFQKRKYELEINRLQMQLRTTTIKDQTTNKWNFSTAKSRLLHLWRKVRFFDI
jgi:hypothetical protein